MEDKDDDDGEQGRIHSWAEAGAVLRKNACNSEIFGTDGLTDRHGNVKRVRD